YKITQRHQPRLHLVVLLGPSHRLSFNGMALCSSDYYQTPLGNVAIDHQLDNELLEISTISILDEAHKMEHSLEVQLPFLQTVLDEFHLIPIVVGDCKPETISQVLELALQQDNTLIVISSDLSHYHDYQYAKQIDQLTSDAIEQLRYEDIAYEQACGRNPIRGLLAYSRAHHLHASVVDLRNSGDTAGPKDRVVGYGAYVIQ
ncbi:MAG: AmmeMemoRadiSam system protein B, partial [Gammaproteobacteria bacterium]|nr:AmmeMemoRadiSam system protein B [Gammaproteobacteria bacterium]